MCVLLLIAVFCSSKCDTVSIRVWVFPTVSPLPKVYMYVNTIKYFHTRCKFDIYLKSQTDFGITWSILKLNLNKQPLTVILIFPYKKTVIRLHGYTLRMETQPPRMTRLLHFHFQDYLHMMTYPAFVGLLW